MGQANPDIGTITCPFTGAVAALRRYRTGQRLAYFHSPAGKIAPNLPEGQKFIFDHAEFWDPEDKRQIETYLRNKGIPANSGETPSKSREPIGDEPEMVETVIGGGSGKEPEAIAVERGGESPAVQPAPVRTPARVRGAWERFIAGDEE